jgi:hypothetical protein
LPLAGSLQVASPARLAQLQDALNTSRQNPPGDFTTCLEGDGKSAAVLVAYPGGTASRVVYVDPECQELATGSATYILSLTARSLIATWTGKW